MGHRGAASACCVDVARRDGGRLGRSSSPMTSARRRWLQPPRSTPVPGTLVVGAAGSQRRAARVGGGPVAGRCAGRWDLQRRRCGSNGVGVVGVRGKAEEHGDQEGHDHGDPTETGEQRVDPDRGAGAGVTALPTVHPTIIELVIDRVTDESSSARSSSAAARRWPVRSTECVRVAAMPAPTSEPHQRPAFATFPAGWSCGTGGVDLGVL